MQPAPRHRSAPKVARPKKPLPPPRVRREEPTIPEAIAAAQCLSDDVDVQVEIAASLMGVSTDDVRPHLPRPTRVATASIFAGRRAVVVERRPSRSGATRLSGLR